MDGEALIEGGIEQLGNRVGVFGGTFDPVHNGHVALVHQFKKQCGLDSVVIIPAALPPHKLTLPLSSFAHRYAMLELAFAGVAGVYLSRLEQRRQGPSYTIDTLKELTESVTGNRCWFLVLGADAFAEIHTWKQYKKIVDLVCLVVFNRGTDSENPLIGLVPKMFADYSFAEERRTFFDEAGDKIQFLDMPTVAASSSVLRESISTGKEWQQQVPTEVVAYITDHNLYTSNRS